MRVLFTIDDDPHFLHFAFRSHLFTLFFIGRLGVLCLILFSFRSTAREQYGIGIGLGLLFLCFGGMAIGMGVFRVSVRKVHVLLL